MKNQTTTYSKLVKKLTLKKTSIRALNPSQQKAAGPGPTAQCSIPC